MRIGLLTTSFPRHEGDSAGRFVLGHARALAARGHAIEVLAPEPAERCAPPRFAGIDVRFVPYVRPRSWARTFYGAGVPDNVRSDLRAALGLAPFCAAQLGAAWRGRAAWDAIVSHFVLPSALVAAAIAGGRPHLAVVHSADLHLLTRLPKRTRLAQALVAGATQLQFVSARHRARFVELLPEAQRADAAARCFVQPMGIESPVVPAPDREALRSALGLSRFTLLSVARLVPVKGLCEAVAALAHRSDLEWLIAGDGPERGRLEALASRSRMRVRLLGEVPHAELARLLAVADAFALPSRVLDSGRTEGVPAALLEAMSAGLPVIAADVGGISEVVCDEETGLLVAPDGASALEACVDRLRADPALAERLATCGQREARRHEWSAIAPRLEAALGLGFDRRHTWSRSPA